MTKKKDHLYQIDDLAKSVLLGVAIKSVCGREDTFTRERLDETRYGAGCKNCMALAAKDATAKSEAIHIHPKEGWQRLIEKAWRYRYEDSIRPRVTVSGGWSPTYSYTFTLGDQTIAVHQRKEQHNEEV